MNDSRLIEPAVRPVNGIVTIPGSKSITNRALILAALADGVSVLNRALYSDDTRYMSASLRRLGIPVAEDEARALFRVRGAAGRIPENHADLFVGNAGTAARFLTAFCALGEGTYRLDGTSRMRERPINDLLCGLTQLGVDASSDLGNGCPPVTIRSNGLKGGSLQLKADVSSQYLTAILIISAYSLHGVEIDVAGSLASKPYVDMTLRMMRQWGVAVETDTRYRQFRIPPGQRYASREYTVEPDASSASYFFAAAAITGGRVRVPGIGSDALQGDADFVEILARMGCTVEIGEDYLEVRGTEHLGGIDVDMNGISDTVMTLAAIAPFADSPTHIRNVEHIRYKETDRIRAVANELRRLGASVEERQDGLTIQPASCLRPAEIETYDDHRMAMAFAITGLRSPGVTIKDPDCVNKTFPDFFYTLDSLVRGTL